MSKDERSDGVKSPVVIDDVKNRIVTVRGEVALLAAFCGLQRA